MSTLTSLLEKALLLSEVNQKKVGCLVGAAIADAAARPLHWVYDLGQLDKAIASSPDTPEFWPESVSPFYTLPTGENSCYFDQAYAVMTSLKNKKEYDFNNICDEFEKQLGAGSRYDMKAREEYMWLRREGKVQGPIKGKWLHGGMIKFFENRRQGKLVGDSHIKETDGFCCALPVVVKYAGNSDLMDKVLEVTKTQSTWPVAVSHALVASKIVEAFIQNETDPFDFTKKAIKSDFPGILKELEMIESIHSTPHVQAVGYVFGRPCYNPGSFMGAIHAVQTSATFEEAVRSTIKAGGCNCSRSFFIGAMLGAKLGIKGLPRSWIEKTTYGEEVLKTAMEMLD